MARTVVAPDGTGRNLAMALIAVAAALPDEVKAKFKFVPDSQNLAAVGDFCVFESGSTVEQEHAGGTLPVLTETATAMVLTRKGDAAVPILELAKEMREVFATLYHGGTGFDSLLFDFAPPAREGSGNEGVSVASAVIFSLRITQNLAI